MEAVVFAPVVASRNSAARSGTSHGAMTLGSIGWSGDVLVMTAVTNSATRSGGAFAGGVSGQGSGPVIVWSLWSWNCSV